MKESFKTRLMRFAFNFFPAYRMSGGRITFISDDLRNVKIKLPLNWKTKNIVGTIYGGSMYGAIDPIYMVMFLKLLGKDYIVWDKSAKIEFKRPGRDILTAEFNIDNELLNDIRQELEEKKSITKDFVVELLDKNNKVSAKIEKTLYFQKNKAAAN